VINLPTDVLERYSALPVPRYTSYPSANHWVPKDETFAREALARASGRPLSLYVHVPFCHRLCFYCGCNMQVTRRRELVERYLDALAREIELVAAAAGETGEVVQLHLGGGTPTFLDENQLTRLVQAVRGSFRFSSSAELSIEVHPPVTSFSQLSVLRALGFDRVSMGVQDFDPVVQRRINRAQPFEQTRALIDESRRLGFRSVNVDLMYGLPSQTLERYAATLDQVLTLKPDRLAVFGYAHLPAVKPHQRLLEGPDLPDARLRLSLLELALARLLDAGYESIGLDHFALSTDDLFRARADGTLRRNFMGYTTCADSEVLAFGPSSISEVRGAFLQNARDTRAWASCIERGVLPVERGWLCSSDDLERAKLLQALFCSLELDADAVSRCSAIELEALQPLIADGLVERAGSTMRVTPNGRLLLRNIAAAFDPYLRRSTHRQHAAAV
jgi:oxygen-independent coproporphyrinogen-3 oxidase